MPWAWWLTLRFWQSLPGWGGGGDRVPPRGWVVWLDAIGLPRWMVDRYTVGQCHFFVALFRLEKQCLGLFRGFFRGFFMAFSFWAKFTRTRPGTVF